MKALEIWFALRAAEKSARGARVLLHLVALARDGKWGWHLAGIRRELPF